MLREAGNQLNVWKYLTGSWVAGEQQVERVWAEFTAGWSALCTIARMNNYMQPQTISGAHG